MVIELAVAAAIGSVTPNAEIPATLHSRRLPDNPPPRRRHGVTTDT